MFYSLKSSCGAGVPACVDSASLEETDKRIAELEVAQASDEARLDALERGATPSTFKGGPPEPAGKFVRTNSSYWLSEAPPQPQIGVYYPNWIDWVGSYHGGSNSAYANFSYNMYLMLQASVPTSANGLPTITRVYVGFYAPNPSLGTYEPFASENPIGYWDYSDPANPVLVQNSTTYPYPFFVPKGSNGWPGSSMPTYPMCDAIVRPANPDGTWQNWFDHLKDEISNNHNYPYSVWKTWVTTGGFTVANLPSFVISIGGWSYSRDLPLGNPVGHPYFDAFDTLTPAQYAAWATAAVNYARHWGFSGIDIDFEAVINDKNYGASGIFNNIATALATACDNLAPKIPCTTTPSSFTDFISLTVMGNYTEVGGALTTELINNSYIRVVNMMLYDSGPLTTYEPRDFANQFVTGINTGAFQDPPRQDYPAIPVNKLSFGFEFTPQAVDFSAGAYPFSTDPLVVQTLASYCEYLAGHTDPKPTAPWSAFKEVFLWMFSPPDLPVATFAMYYSNVLSGLYYGTEPVFNNIAQQGTVQIPYNYITNGLYGLGVINVKTDNSWIPGKPAPSSFRS